MRRSAPASALLALILLATAPAAAQVHDHDGAADHGDHDGHAHPSPPADWKKPEWLDRLPQPQVPGVPKPPERPEIPAAERLGLLWRLTAPSGGTVYVTAGVHVGLEVVYPMPDAVERAFEASDVLAVESDPTLSDRNLEKLELRRAALPKGVRLKDRLGPEAYTEAEALFTDFGLELSIMESVAPWFVALRLREGLIEKDGLRHANGLDAYFVRKTGKRRVVELEGHAARIRALAALGGAHPDLMMRWAAADARRVVADAIRVEELWARGDAEGVHTALSALRRTSEEYEPIYAALRDARARDLARALGRQARKGRTVFAVVDARRLLGEGGVLALLGEAGWKAEAIREPSKPRPEPAEPTAPERDAHGHP